MVKQAWEYSLQDLTSFLVNRQEIPENSGAYAVFNWLFEWSNEQRYHSKFRKFFYFCIEYFRYKSTAKLSGVAEKFITDYGGLE